MKQRADIRIASLTDTGREREANQDCFGVFETAEAEHARRGRLAVVCDGMGGAAGGEVASRLAVETILARFAANEAVDPDLALREAIEAANAAIWARASDEPALEGMGSTCVALAAHGGRAWIAHVGDSRCYLLRGGALTQIGRDHSVVQQFVDEGVISEEDAERHPQKNIILRSLGVRPAVAVDIEVVTVAPGDVFLLASDGLTGVVSKAECRWLVETNTDPAAAARALVDLANARGGPDNITVQVVQFPASEVAPAPAAASQAPRASLLRRVLALLFGRQIAATQSV